MTGAAVILHPALFDRASRAVASSDGNDASVACILQLPRSRRRSFLVAKTPTGRTGVVVSAHAGAVALHSAGMAGIIGHHPAFSREISSAPAEQTARRAR